MSTTTTTTIPTAIQYSATEFPAAYIESAPVIDFPVQGVRPRFAWVSAYSWDRLDVHRFCHDTIKANIRIFRGVSKPAKKRSKGIGKSKQHRRYMPHAKEWYVNELYKRMRYVALEYPDEMKIDCKYLKSEYQY